MAGSNQYTCGTVPTLLAAAPVSASPGPVGWFAIANGGTTSVTLGGGTAASTFQGVPVAAGGSLSGFLFSGDQVFGATAAGTATSVGVLQTGA